MNQAIPSQKQFLSLSKKGNLVPVFREFLGDTETPVSAYLKLTKKSKYSFLLESVEGEEKVARYSFLAKDPELVFSSKGRKARIIRYHQSKKTENFMNIFDTPLEFLRELMAQYRPVAVEGLPRFCGGLVGFMSYDIVRFFEKIPSQAKDDLNLPDMVFILAKQLIIFDHLAHKIKVVSCATVNPDGSKLSKIKAYHQAIRKINQIIKELKTSINSQSINRKRPRLRSRIKVRSNMSQKRFESIVQSAKRNIRAGDIIQTVLSQRFHVKLATDPLNVYRALRSVNPSPYMFYLNFDGLHIAGSSPEMLVRVENGNVETRPIAGTRPRGMDEKKDQQLAKDLLKDPKEKAEHIMLVDLGRNDLGRVCKKGSVHVSEFMNIEKYSHVMHIVSNVRGELKPGQDYFDVIQASFPAGTVSGAPKIRAMKIIENLEPHTRGPYAGCVGYFDFYGNSDTCITIRTIIMDKKKAYIQAGAGIVADSHPRKEFQETINKAKAQVKAIELASNHID